MKTLFEQLQDAFEAGTKEFKAKRGDRRIQEDMEEMLDELKSLQSKGSAKAKDFTEKARAKYQAHKDEREEQDELFEQFLNELLFGSKDDCENDFEDDSTVDSTIDLMGDVEETIHDVVADVKEGFIDPNTAKNLVLVLAATKFELRQLIQYILADRDERENIKNTIYEIDNLIDELKYYKNEVDVESLNSLIYGLTLHFKL